MSIFLVGQPELNDRLADERLLPLRQRIGIRFHLQPFSEQETKKYITFRLAKAGGQFGGIFTEEALQRIHAESKGVPRLINVLCDQALLSGFAEGLPQIDASIIQGCIAEIHIPGEESSLPVSPPGESTQVSWQERKIYWVIFFGIVVLVLGGIFWAFNNDVLN
jgi:general secretion pathway protein A